MRKRLQIAVATLSLGLTAPAFAATAVSTFGLSIIQFGGPNVYTFFNPSWTGGGVVNGSFTATDLDGNGQISSFRNEVTAFNLLYSGGTTVSTFSLGFGSLSGLVYDLPTSGIGGLLGDGTALDIEGMRASNGTFTFALGPGPVSLCNGVNACGRIDGPAISGVVPEPSTWVMLIAGFGLIGSVLRGRPRISVAL